jgi:hypothetical protein
MVWGLGDAEATPVMRVMSIVLECGEYISRITQC